MYKSASGSMEYMQIFKVPNIKTTIKYLKEKNFWVYAFDSKTEKDFTDVNWSGNNIFFLDLKVLVLRNILKSMLTTRLKLILTKKSKALNISNSAAIVFHHIKKIMERK